MDSTQQGQNATVYADNATLIRQLQELFANLSHQASENDEPRDNAMVVKGRQRSEVS